MSTSKPGTKPDRKDQYEPSAGLMTPAQFQDMASFFFKLGESKSAKILAVLAGISAILEGTHVLWLAFVWIVGRLPR